LRGIVADKINKDFPHVPDRISGLIDLAYNLWWSWNPAVKMVFKNLNPQAWIESIHNPVKMLRELPEETMIAASKNPLFLRHYDLVIARFQQEMSRKTGWFTDHFPTDNNLTIAYFSAEYVSSTPSPFMRGASVFWPEIT
jgi:starch phosphorylase